MKALLCTILILASAYSYGGEKTIEKSIAPDIVILRLAGSGLAQFSIRFAELPTPPLGGPMKIEQILWRTTFYPYDTVNETVEICYEPYGPQRANPPVCEDIVPNSAGIAHTFNSLRFGHESRLLIRHKITGGRQTLRPAGKDMVTIRVSY